MRGLWMCAVVCLGFVDSVVADEPDVLIADFEGEDYGDWITTGTAFGPGPARGTLANQMEVSGYEGKGLVNSFFELVQSNQKREVGPSSRQMTIERRYLQFPVKNGAASVRMKVTVGDRIVDEFDIELAPATPSFWAFLDMENYQGQQATIDVDRLPSDSQGLAQVRQQDEIPGAATLYQEKYRPQFHFSPRIGWNNDPNGLVFSKGEWHLYFQHNPYGWNWGNMHWGHAVSSDLVHWAELPIAIYPYKHGDWVFSGGAVVDTGQYGRFQIRGGRRYRRLVHEHGAR